MFAAVSRLSIWFTGADSIDLNNIIPPALQKAGDNFLSEIML